MKKLIVLLFALCLYLGAFAQQLNYQAVIRDDNQQLVTNTNVTANIVVKVGGSAVYQQTVNGTTNLHGLFDIPFGDATFSSIDWPHATISVQVKNTSTGVIYMPAEDRPVNAVPYALNAANAASATQVNADWNATSGVAEILNKPTLFSGDYNDLTNKPTLFDGDYSSLTNTPEIPTVPTNVSAFTNDAGYLTSFTESQILTQNEDTIFLTGGSYVVVPQQSAFYFLTYNANTGTGSMNAQIFPVGVAQTIMYNGFTKTGYDFAGWNEAADNTGASHAEGESLTLTDNKELFAQWTLQHYTISYINNGGEGSMESQAYVYGTPQNLTANSFTKTGHVFNGWNTNADGSGIAYADQNNLSATSNLTLYAQWVPETYTLTFMANNGTDEQATQTFTYGQAQNLMSNPFTYSGYNFADWNTAADGNGDGYSDHKNMTLTADMTLYARWTLIPTFVVTFNANGGTGTMANQTFMQGVAQELAHNTFTREGFDFMGWNTNASGMGTYYSDGQSVTLNTTTTLYAKWQKNSNYEEPATKCVVSSIRSNETGVGDSITAVRDHQNNTYAVVQIGNQCWLKENMRATTSPSTGTDILQLPLQNYSYTGKRAYYPQNNADTAAKYGVLYNWNAAVDTFNTTYGETSYGTNSANAVYVLFTGNRRGICPEGWHVPSDNEWSTMLTAAGVIWNNGAGKLAGGNDWDVVHYVPVSDDDVAVEDYSVPGNYDYALRNQSGFSAVPAGAYTGNAFSLGSKTNFWSATNRNRYQAYAIALSNTNTGSEPYDFAKNVGNSVRCVRD